MRLRLVILLAAAAGITACSKSAPTAKTDDEKALYALGVLLAQNVKSFEFTDEEIEFVKAGIADGARDKATMEMEETEKFIPQLQELNNKRMEAAGKREKEAGTAYLAKAATEAGVTKTASGLLYKVVQEGTGASPTAADTVTVQYEGRFVGGKVFDKSSPDQPATFPLGGVIPCWTEGVQLMKVGGKAQLVCPSDIAYGEQGQPPRIPGGAALVFDVELIDIVKQDPAAAAGPHPASPH